MTLDLLHSPSPNFDDRDRDQPVDMLVIHYTGMESGQAALDRLCDPAAQVSAHYLIEEDGRTFQLVALDKRAWHAGVSYWRGSTNINARSIGIELVNPGHEFGYRRFPELQFQSLLTLCKAIMEDHNIPPINVVGHSDVAPRRKEDPGEKFDWARLAVAGIGLWPRPGGPIAAGERDLLIQAIGYEWEDPGATLRAFQRHYRPKLITGDWDSETEVLVRQLAAFARLVV